MDAARAFTAEADRLWFPVDLALYRECLRACWLPFRHEQELIDRLAKGAALLLTHRNGLYDPSDPMWQRWLVLLTAWHCCHAYIEWSKETPDSIFAAESAALTPTNVLRF